MSTPAFDLDAFLALPRLANLHLSPDGSRLAATVQTVAADGQSFVGAVWELATSGDRPPRRLTWSAKGETARGFLPDGSLLFTSVRPGFDGDDAAGHDADALYVLPSAGGEPRSVLAPGDGVGAVVTARASSLVVVSTGLFPGSRGLDEDRARQKARADAGVTARLVEHYPDRYWDHDIGPREPHLVALDLADPGGELPPPRDLTPDPPWAGWFEDVHFALSDDGSRVAFGAITHPAPRYKINLATAATSGEPGFRVLVDAEVDHRAMAWSPDGATLAVASMDLGAPDAPPHFHISLLDAATGAVRELAPEWQALAMEIGWTRDGRALLVTADDHGHAPLFRVDLDGAVTRLTASGAYSHITPAPDGTTLYAIRSHINEPPVPVALDVARANQEPRVLPSPVTPGPVGARLEELTVTAADGAPVHSWLVLPAESTDRALPLAVMIHGGPVAAWGGWHWRWSASLLAARGWAVLLPNPRLSTGYGYSHFASAWSDWATLPAGDILASIDAAVARPDIDADRTAAMGGSYGGYMANWLAGGTDRFRAIVTHASVWNLIMQRDVCDVGFGMDDEFGSPLRDEETWRRQSPHLRADALSSPMLVIHGLRDQRVPIGNAHSLWMELQLRGIPSRLLLFPDENHWILKPQNARVWYETVFGFLDEHVLDKAWSRPALL